MRAWVRQWDLWRLPAAALAYVLALQAVVLVLALATARPPTASLADAAVLTGIVLGALATCWAVARHGADQSDAGITVDSNDIWHMAAALLLPPALLLPFVYLFQCCLVDDLGHRLSGRTARPLRRARPHQRLFNAAMTAAAATAAQAVFAAAAAGSPLDSARGAGAAALALLSYGLLHEALLTPVLVLAVGQQPSTVARRLLPSVPGQVTGLACGVLFAYAWTATPLAALFVVPLADALQRSALHHDLLHRSTTDDKTGLINADAWRLIAHQRTQRARTGELCSVLLLDLDHFKLVNDTHGHLAGDEVLRQVAARLLTVVRPDDVVGRFGGEEFSVLLPDADAYQASLVAERCVDAVRSRPLRLHDGSELRITASAGTATSGLDAASLQELLQRADEALYRAKRTGRDRVAVGSRA